MRMGRNKKEGAVMGEIEKGGIGDGGSEEGGKGSGVWLVSMRVAGIIRSFPIGPHASQ